MNIGQDNMEFNHEVKVSIKGFSEYKGYSDLVETYCCSSTPAYYVIFPELPYSGYFNKRDVQVKKEEGGICVSSEKSY